MRLLVTADLHYNHARSRPLAEELIEQMNRAGGDALLVVGDTAVAEGDWLERALSRVGFAGPKLFLCGNHELWSAAGDSAALFAEEVPRRVRALGWRWLEAEPFVAGDVAVVGTVGWYDYAFASARLGIPRRFYEAKMSPAAAEYLGRADVLGDRADIPPQAMRLMGRWNDGKFVRLGQSDEAFAGACADRLAGHLSAVAGVGHVVVATHHVPLAELLPPPRPSGAAGALEFARAYLGSPRLGEAIRGYDNVRHVVCGHSHFRVEARVGGARALNLGAGYGWKTFETIELPD